MQYKVYSNNEYLGTFDTTYNIYSLYKMLCIIFERDSLSFAEINNSGFENKFYVYRFMNQQCSKICLLGSFETNLNLHKVYDYLFQLFSGDSEQGIFIRKEKLI